MRTEDGCIIQECLNGKPEAFGMLVDKYKAGIYAFVYGRLGNFQDAQDVTQEVFEEAYRCLRGLKRWESFVFWLYRIARNLCTDWFRIQSRRPDREFIEDQDQAILEISSLASYRENQVNKSLREALDSLPEIYREVILLYYFGGMTIKDIARAIGASPTAIGTRLSRARAQLREEMVAMMDTDFEGQKLQSSFTFRVVEAVKRIKVRPIPRAAGLPWGMSLAAGIIIAILSVGTHLNLTSTESYTSISSLSGESRALDIGEFPVDVMKVSDVTITSIQQLAGDGLGNVVSGMQNAFLMAPQAGDTWTKKADMPTARFGLSTSVVNGKIYAIGGTIHANGKVVCISTVEEYDPATDKWTNKTDMPTPRQYLSISVVDGKVYAIGGFGGGAIERSTVEEYDPTIDKWTKKADILTPRMYFSTSVVNGRIYAIGGWKSGEAIASAEEYDPAVDEWRKLTDMPTTRRGVTTGVVNGRIYAIGGGNPKAGFNTSSIVEEYDPQTDTWRRKADMPTAGAFLSSSTVNGKIYVFGSWNEGNSEVYPVVAYDPVNDTWTRKANLPTARLDFSVSEVKGKIYVIGGFGPDKNNIGHDLSIVEEYDTGFSGEGVDFKGKLPTTWGEVRTALSK